MIYLDNNATTHLDPNVHDLLRDLLTQKFGNPSSVHHFGRQAKNLLYPALDSVAKNLGVSKRELVITSGATEGLNMALLGLKFPKHIITSRLEHLSLLEPLQLLAKRGTKITYLRPKNGLGSIDVKQIEEAVTVETTLIALSWANNETGIVNDIEAIASFATERNILFLVDGIAFLGKAPLKIPEGVSAICFSGHKIHGPHGIGVLVCRKRHKLNPLIVGGPQQEGRRGGTENVFGICGFARALEMITADDFARMTHLRNHFERELKRYFPLVVIHGENERRISNTSSVYFPGISGEDLLMRLDLAGVAASLGSACSAGALEPSHVLLNMGYPPQVALSTLRFSLSRFTTEEELERALKILKDVIQ